MPLQAQWQEHCNSLNNILNLYRIRQKKRENAAYAAKGDELSARKALSKSTQATTIFTFSFVVKETFLTLWHHMKQMPR